MATARTGVSHWKRDLRTAIDCARSSERSLALRPLTAYFHTFLFASLLLAVLAPHAAEADVAIPRTVVIFGDTQDLVAGDPELYAGFTAMVDWVLANRESESIDFVLHVGDVIERGGGILPLRSECADEDGDCDPARHWDRQDGRQVPCLCDVLEEADRQWARFNAQWRRFAGVLPYAIVRGNHDNRGVDPDDPLDRPGFEQYYGEPHFRGISRSGLVSSHRDDTGLSHAWLLPLADRELLVIGAGFYFSSRATSWAEHVLDKNPGIPAIALSHSFFHGLPPDRNLPRQNWKRLVASHPERFALAVSGHVAPGRIEFVDVGGYRVLTIRSNWQGLEGSRTFLHLVRFTGSPESSGAVEVQAIDPVARTIDVRPPAMGRTWLPRTPFALDAEARRVPVAIPGNRDSRAATSTAPRP